MCKENELSFYVFIVYSLAFDFGFHVFDLAKRRMEVAKGE